MLPPRPAFAFRKFTLSIGLGVAAYLTLGIAFFAIAPMGALPQAGAGSTSPSAPQSVTPSNPAQEPDASKFVLKAQVPLVVIDVVVTDKKGQPVHGLKQSDFTVLEKREVMTVQSFEEIRSDEAVSSEAPPRPPAPVNPPPVLPPNVFTNRIYTKSHGPLNILLLDFLNQNHNFGMAADQMFMRKATVQYLDQLPEGTPVAIFGLHDRLFIIQAFTTDRGLLKSVENSKLAWVWNPPSTMTGTAQITNEALENLGRYLAGLPGRKNLIWLCGAFRTKLLPTDEGYNLGPMGNYTQDVRFISNLLTRAQVSLYPIDVRGLFSDSDYGAQNSCMGQSGGRCTNPLAVIQSFNASTANFFFDTSAQHFYIDQVAKETGGKAYYDRNDLKDAVGDAVSTGSNYYALTYSPTNRNWDGNYRRIEVKVNQPNLNLSYRRGYFAIDPIVPIEQVRAPGSHPDGGKAKGASPAPVVLSKMDKVMMRRNPDPTQIIFTAKISPQDELDRALPPSNKPNGKLMKQPYRRYTITYSPEAKDLSFTTTPDGARHDSIELVAVLWTPDGEVVNSTAATVELDLHPATFDALMKNGMQLTQIIDAPKKGEYFLRLGIHDLNSDYFGAVEVPLAAIKSEPASASALTPAAAPQK